MYYVYILKMADALYVGLLQAIAATVLILWFVVAVSRSASVPFEPAVIPTPFGSASGRLLTKSVVRHTNAIHSHREVTLV
jgi:hypothetical protein